MEIRAAVLRRAGENFRIERVTLDEPRAGEALVRIVAAGICATDIHVQHQDYWFPLPAVLGHEGAGIVEKVGPGVTAARPGDHVVLAYAYCGCCPACRGGRPFACADYDELNWGGRMADGSARLHRHGRDLAALFGQASFATHAVVGENNLVPVDPDLDLRLLAPLGCGVQTGAGAVLNHFRAGPGAKLAVFGAGAVGLSAVMAAKAAGCSVIVASDLHDHRLALAAELGATHTLDARRADVAAEIARITGGGADFALEASGRADVGRQAADALAAGGKLAYVSAPPALDYSVAAKRRRLTITGIVEGDSVPQVFLPYLIGLYRAGRFPLDRLARFYPFAAINRAVADARGGATVKPILVMPG